jgi:hypothetical protein
MSTRCSYHGNLWQTLNDALQPDDATPSMRTDVTKLMSKHLCRHPLPSLPPWQYARPSSCGSPPNLKNTCSVIMKRCRPNPVISRILTLGNVPLPLVSAAMPKARSCRLVIVDVSPMAGCAAAHRGSLHALRLANFGDNNNGRPAIICIGCHHSIRMTCHMLKRRQTPRYTCA